MKIIRQFMLSLFLIVICSATVKAQGIRAGANFAGMSGDLNDLGDNNGFYIGVYYELPIIKDLLYIVPELQYSQQGFGDVNLDYINVPVLAKVYLIKILALEAGPQFGFKISDSGGTINYDYNNFGVALAAGLSINLPFRLSIQGRYFGDLTETVEGFDAKNKVFQAGLAFRFK